MVYLLGDIRVNEQPGLISMHTIFIRLHNLIEEQSYRQTPHWDSERLYQVHVHTMAA